MTIPNTPFEDWASHIADPERLVSKAPSQIECEIAEALQEAYRLGLQGVEDGAAAHQRLDELGVPRALASGEILSLLGRINTLTNTTKKGM